VEDKVLHLIDHMGMGGAQRIVSKMTESPSTSVHSLRRAEDTIDTNGKSSSVTDSSSRYNLRCLIDVYMRSAEGSFDILHCHLLKSKIVGAAIKLFSRKDFDVVFHEHGRIFKEGLFYSTFLRMTRKLVDGHIAVSEKAVSLMDKNGSIPSKEIEVLYNFADRSDFDPENAVENNLEDEIVKASSSLSEKEFLVGFAGRIIERKGWRTLVSASEKMGEDVGILMAGTGPEKELLERKVLERDNILYLGYIEDIRQLLGNIDCLVLPSQWDPCPMIFFEAQAMGVPVVCSDVSSVNELIEDGKNGVLFEPEDPEDLAASVNEVKRFEDLREQLGEAGLEFASSHDSENYRNRLEEAYERVLDRGVD